MVTENVTAPYRNAAVIQAGRVRRVTSQTVLEGVWGTDFATGLVTTCLCVNVCRAGMAMTVARCVCTAPLPPRATPVSAAPASRGWDVRMSALTTGSVSTQRVSVTHQSEETRGSGRCVKTAAAPEMMDRAADMGPVMRRLLSAPAIQGGKGTAATHLCVPARLSAQGVVLVRKEECAPVCQSTQECPVNLSVSTARTPALVSVSVTSPASPACAVITIVHTMETAHLPELVSVTPTLATKVRSAMYSSAQGGQRTARGMARVTKLFTSVTVRQGGKAGPVRSLSVLEIPSVMV